MKSHKWKGKFVIPGGKVELGESLEQALRREVKEETNLDIYDLQFICWQEFIFDNHYYKKRHFIFFDYACRTKNEKVKLNEEAEEYSWFGLKQALQAPAEPFTKKAIREYIKQQKIKI